MNDKNLRLFTVIIWAIVTVIWIANTVLHIYYDTSEFLIILNLFAAIAAFAAFTANFIRYKNAKK